MAFSPRLGQDFDWVPTFLRDQPLFEQLFGQCNAKQTECFGFTIDNRGQFGVGDLVVVPPNAQWGAVVNVDTQREILPLQVRTRDGETRWFSATKLEPLMVGLELAQRLRAELLEAHEKAQNAALPPLTPGPSAGLRQHQAWAAFPSNAAAEGPPVTPRGVAKLLPSTPRGVGGGGGAVKQSAIGLSMASAAQALEAAAQRSASAEPREVEQKKEAKEQKSGPKVPSVVDDWTPEWDEEARKAKAAAAAAAAKMKAGAFREATEEEEQEHDREHELREFRLEEEVDEYGDEDVSDEGEEEESRTEDDAEDLHDDFHAMFQSSPLAPAPGDDPATAAAAIAGPNDGKAEVPALPIDDDEWDDFMFAPPSPQAHAMPETSVASAGTNAEAPQASPREAAVVAAAATTCVRDEAKGGASEALFDFDAVDVGGGGGGTGGAPAAAAGRPTRGGDAAAESAVDSAAKAAEAAAMAAEGGDGGGGGGDTAQAKGALTPSHAKARERLHQRVEKYRQRRAESRGQDGAAAPAAAGAKKADCEGPAADPKGWTGGPAATAVDANKAGTAAPGECPEGIPAPPAPPAQPSSATQAWVADDAGFALFGGGSHDEGTL